MSRFHGSSKTLARWFCGFVFLAAALAKISYPGPYLETVGQIGWIPAFLKPAVITILPFLELGLAGVLLAGWRERWTARVAFAVLLVFTGVLLVLPKGVDCGCFGELPRALAWLSQPVGAISRNVVLLGLTAWLGFFPVAPQAFPREVSQP